MSDDTSDTGRRDIIIYNQEVTEDVRIQLENDLRDTFHVSSSKTVYQHSATVPELVQILLEAATWKNGLGTAAAIFLKAYLEKLGNKAAESTWNLSVALAKILKDKSVASLKKVTDAIFRVRKSLSSRSRFIIGLPYPEDYHGTLLTIETNDREEVALVLALFAVEAEEIQNRLSQEVDETQVLGAITLGIDDDGAFVATWMDHALQEHEIKIPTPLSE